MSTIVNDKIRLKNIETVVLEGGELSEGELQTVNGGVRPVERHRHYSGSICEIETGRREKDDVIKRTHRDGITQTHIYPFNDDRYPKYHSSVQTYCAPGEPDEKGHSYSKREPWGEHKQIDKKLGSGPARDI